MLVTPLAVTPQKTLTVKLLLCLSAQNRTEEVQILTFLCMAPPRDQTYLQENLGVPQLKLLSDK